MELTSPQSAVSMSTWFLNLHPKTFPDPWKFKPERWIEAAQKGFPPYKLPRKLQSRDQGLSWAEVSEIVLFCTRMSECGDMKVSQELTPCLNYSLAYAELYMTLTRLCRQFDVELVDATAKSVAIERVHFTGYPRLTSGGTNSDAEVKVKVTHKLET